MPSRTITKPQIFVNGGLRPFLNLVTCERSAGGQSLDLAIIELDPQSQGHIQSIFTLDSTEFRNAEVEILGGAGQVIHWGTIAYESIRLAASDERAIEVTQFTSQLAPWHFGNPALDYVTANTNASGQVSGTKILHRDLEFNPLVDGRIQGSQRNSTVGPNPANVPDSMGVFLDPDSTRTAAARAANGSSFDWTFADAIHYLCWTLNPTQRYIQNPLRTELAGIQVIEDYVRDFKVKTGEFLPTILDRLCAPASIQWFVELSQGQRKLRFYRRAGGSQTTIGRGTTSFHLSAPGVSVNPAADSVVELSVSNDVSTSANGVYIVGAPARVEATFTLQRAWSDSDDNLVPELNQKQDENGDPNPAYDENAWQKWVLNEAGDYNGIRASITEHFDLFGLFDQTAFDSDELPFFTVTPKRRRFLPMLTTDADGVPLGLVRGCEVEYTGLGGEWTPVKNCSILDSECGIRFNDASQVPDDLVANGATASVRITATVELDRRLVGFKLANNFADTPRQIMIDLAERFRWQKLTSSSKYFGAGNPSTSTNDTATITAYAASMLDLINVADLRGQIVLEGLDRVGFEIGNNVTGITGRGIDFPVGTQIVAIQWDNRAQRTVVLVGRFRPRVA